MKVMLDNAAVGQTVEHASVRVSNKIYLTLLGSGVIAGLMAVLYVLATGHHHAFNLTREIPWGILIATYEFFVVVSTGLCVVASLGHVFGVKQFEQIGKRALVLAILTLFGGFAAMAMELNHPIRMLLWVVLTPNLHSPIWWMGTLYGFYLSLLCLQLYALMKGNKGLAATAGALGVAAAVATHSNLGAVLGLLEARPFWHGSFMPVYFSLTSIVCGGAVTGMLVYFNRTFRGMGATENEVEFMQVLGKLQALVLGILIVFIIWKIIPGLYGKPPGKYEATMAVLTGPLAFNFWFFEVLIGLVIPFAILTRNKFRTPLGIMVAGVSAVIGVFFMRYDLVVAGQMVPMRIDVAEGAQKLLSYSPAAAELAIVTGAVCLCILAYVVTEKKLKLN